MSGALGGKKSQTIHTKSKSKFIKGDTVQYNPTTRELHYVSEGKHKTVKLEKDEAMRYLKYFRRCAKGLALDYLVQHHFKTNEQTYQVLQLSTRMSSPEETQKIVRDCETKFKKLIELADSKVKSKVVAVHNVVKKMLETKNRVSIVRDIFFPDLADQHGTKTMLDNKDITEFKDHNVDHDKYTTYIDGDYDKTGLIKVLKREGPEKTYSYFAAKVCESIYDNAKLNVDIKKQAERIRNIILMIYLALNSNMTQKSICGSLYFPVKENDYFLTNIEKVYGINNKYIADFIQDNTIDDNISLSFFTQSQDPQINYDWFTPQETGYMERQEDRATHFHNFPEIKKAWDFIYNISGKGSETICDLYSGSKALIIWSQKYAKKSSDYSVQIGQAFKFPENKQRVDLYGIKTCLDIALRNDWTFNLGALPILSTRFFYFNSEANVLDTGILYYLYKKWKEGDKQAGNDYNALVDILEDKGKRNNANAIKLIRVASDKGVVFYEGGNYNEKAYTDWAEKKEPESRREQKEIYSSWAAEAEDKEKADLNDAIKNWNEWKANNPDAEPEDKVDNAIRIFKKFNKTFAHVEDIDKFVNEHMKQEKSNEEIQAEIEKQMQDEENETEEERLKKEQEERQKRMLSNQGKNVSTAIYEAGRRFPTKTKAKQPEMTKQSDIDLNLALENMPQNIVNMAQNHNTSNSQSAQPVVVGTNTTTSDSSTSTEGAAQSEGLSLRKLKKMGLKPWQIKQIRKQIKKPGAGISELETLNEIKTMLEVLLGKQNQAPVDKAKLPVEPPEQTPQLQSQTTKAENIASVPMMIGDELNARRRALRHVEQQHYVPEVDKNTVKYDIENRNYKLRHVDPVKVVKTLEGLDKMYRKGTLAKNAPYYRIYPETAAVIKMLATRANPNTYKGGVFRTIASLIPGGSAVYEVASRVYNAARPLIDKAVSKYDDMYNNKMKKGCNRRNGYMNSKQLKQYLINNQKPKLSELARVLK